MLIQSNRIFKVGTKYDKTPEYYNSRIIQGSLLAISSTSAATKRRANYSHYFSKTAVRNVEFSVQQKIQRFLHILEEHIRTKQPVDLWRGYRCLTSDIIIDYAYQEDFKALSSPNFKHPIIEALSDTLESSAWRVAPYFGRTVAIIESFLFNLPSQILHYVSPPMVSIRKFQEVWSQDFTCAVAQRPVG